MNNPELDHGLLAPIPPELAEGLPDPRQILSNIQKAELQEQLRILAERRRNAIAHFFKLPTVS